MNQQILYALLLILGVVIAPGAPVTSPSIAPDTDWISAAQREIAEREYRASENGEGLQAPNRAHDLRTYFESTGIRVHDRTDPGRPELASLRLAGVGRGESLSAVAPGEVTSDGARVEIKRPGLVEWFVNTQDGLEQGFTLEGRPQGIGPLLLELAVGPARARTVGDSVVLETPAARHLAYSKLAVADARGVAIAAHFEVPAADRIRLVVDDAEATYPIVIDPLLTGLFDTQLVSDIASSFFGYSVAGAGDVNGDGYGDVIIGAYEYDAGETKEGAAFIYLGSASGIASASSGTATTQIESNQAFAHLGVSVAGAGDVNGDGFDDVIVGSAFDEGEDAEGAAFIFHGSATGIASGNPGTAQTLLQSNQVDASLGYSVASAGDVNGDGYADVIVGAPGYDALISNQPPQLQDAGEAYIFLGSPAGVANGTPATAATRLQGDQPGGSYGATVAPAGDVNGDGFADVVLGAWHYSAGQTDESAVFLYHGSAAGIPDATALGAATRIESDYAGNGIIAAAGAGDVNGDGFSDVIVGLPAAGGSVVGGGGAMVFHGSPTGIPSGSPEVGGFANFIYADQANASLGTSVASAGDVNGDGYADVVIGAPRYDDPTVDEGVAFVLLGSATGTPTGQASATAFARLRVGNASALFGGAVAGAGDVNGDGYADVIAGAFYFGASDEGAAFVFLGGGEGVRNGNPATAATRFEGDQASSYLGFRVSSAGDVNGDGYSDVIVGAYAYDAGENNEGAAFVFLGSASGISDGNPTNAAARLESNQEIALFGSSVSGAGDVNGDGYADVIVGAYQYDAGHYDEGAAFLFLRERLGRRRREPYFRGGSARVGPQVSAQLGTSVAGAGDVNGDGYADVIVGAPLYNAGESGEGAAFLFLGSPSGVADGNPISAAAQLESDQVNALLGASVAGAGDVDADGYADVIVGAYHYDAGELNEGAAFVFRGGASGVADGNPSTATIRIESDQVNARLGVSVAGAGNVNGDGYADVIVGADSYNAGQGPGEGVAFVFNGGASSIVDGSPLTASAQLEADRAISLFGCSVAGVGDVNGDGYSDVIVGAYAYDAGEDNAGAALVFLGSASGIADGNPSTAAARIESDQLNGWMGFSVAGAGDVNGDGYADVIVGALGYDGGQNEEGAAFVFLGNGDGDGRSVVARQFRSDASGMPIQPGGWTGALNTGSFEVRMDATHPLGRGRVKLEVETCAEGLAFGNVACTHHTSASWTDVTASNGGVELAETIGGLAADTHYRWRARVLYAPYSVTQAGITAPLKPEHGPWRRVSGQASEADLLPEPGLALLVASGIALLASLQRRRRTTAY